MTSGGTFKITTAPLIVVEIDDTRIEWFGDPPDGPLLELMGAQSAFGSSPEDQLRGVGVLRECLRGLVVPASRDAWDGLIAAGTISLGVTMQVFEHLTSQYSETLGFRGGQLSKSPGGLPANEGTSEEALPGPVLV